MKRQSICVWAIAIAFALCTFPAPAVQADDSRDANSHRLVEQVKGKPVVADQGDAGDPEIQYGDPDDLGGGDQKGGGTEPPILNPNGDQSTGALEWYMALYEFFKALQITL